MIPDLAAGQLPEALVVCAIAIHLFGCGLCARTAQVAAHNGLPAFEQRGWIACAVAFASLALMRLMGAEGVMRDLLRTQLVQAGSYDQRWSLQSLAATALAVAVVVLIGLFLWRKARRQTNTRTRLLLTAQLALLSFVPLVALRVLSWHQTDRLLYAGPLRLNWLLELLLATVPMIVAAVYLRHVRLRSAQRGRRG